MCIRDSADPRSSELMDNLLSKTAELLANAAADPDRVLKWVLIYFGVSSLGFMGVWLIGEVRRQSSTDSN